MKYKIAFERKLLSVSKVLAVVRDSLLVKLK